MFLTNVVDIKTELETQGAVFDINQFVNAGTQLALAIAILAVMAYVIWAGYEWLTAGGDKAKVEAARSRITNAILGLTIVATVWILFTILDRFFGIGLTTSCTGPLC